MSGEWKVDETPFPSEAHPSVKLYKLSRGDIQVFVSTLGAIVTKFLHKNKEGKFRE